MPRNPLSKANKKVEARHNTFVQEYLTNGFNATQAAIAAGYSEKSICKTSNELINDPRVQAKLQAEFNRRREKFEVTEERVLEELSYLAFSDLSEAFDADGSLKPIKDMPETIRRALAGLDVCVGPNLDITKKLKIWNKEKALEMLGKHFKLFTDKVEHTASEDLANLILKARGRGKKTTIIEEEEFLA